jgi:hypothetical protein
MIRFSQQDARWKNVLLGHGKETIGSAGCLLTCLAMACQAKGYSETPATINEKFKATDGGFYGSWIGLSVLSAAVPGMQYIDRVDCPTVAAPIEKINAYIAAGRIVVALVDYDPEMSGVQDHWVVLERQAGDDYLILDPWPLNENTGAVTLLGRFGKGKTAAEAIYGIVVFGSTGNPAQGSESPSIPSGENIQSASSLQEGGQELPKAGTKLSPIGDFVNDRYPDPSTQSMDVGDIPNGETIILSGDAVMRSDGSIWGPHIKTHWVCISLNGKVLMKEINS